MLDAVKKQLEAIEKLRKEMYSLATTYGLSSLEVLAVSKQLDAALNEYNRMTFRI